MRVVIEIPEQDYKLACKYPEVLFGSYGKSIKNGTVLPDNPTNGDMIKAMFPNERIGHCEDCTDLGDIATFDDDWWNAPYGEDGE